MNAGLFLLAMAGGGVGASLRFISDVIIMQRVHSGYPWGTFIINVTGSLLLGFLTGLASLDSAWLFILGGGVMGGFTTFSTAMVDTVRMLQERTYGRALWNTFGMLVITVVVALLGLLIGRML